MSLFLLGTLLVGMVLARARLVEQAARSEDVLDAVAAAESLLERWWRTPGSLPVGAEGELEGLRPAATALRWRTEEVPDASLGGLMARRVRLEVRRDGEQLSHRPVLTVELLLPGGGRRPPGGQR